MDNRFFERDINFDGLLGSFVATNTWIGLYFFDSFSSRPVGVPVDLYDIRLLYFLLIIPELLLTLLLSAVLKHVSEAAMRGA